MNQALLVGRTPTPLQAKQPPVVTGALFEADRVDKERFEGIRFEHCTFANVSFKEAKLVSLRAAAARKRRKFVRMPIRAVHGPELAFLNASAAGGFFSAILRRL